MAWHMAWHMAWRMAKDCPILNSKMTRSITKLQACHGYWISLVCYVLLISSYSFLAPHTVICAPRPLAVCTESITACDRSCRRMLSLVSTVHAAIMWCHLLDQPSASSALIQMATTCLSSFLISSRECCFFLGFLATIRTQGAFAKANAAPPTWNAFYCEGCLRP